MIAPTKGEITRRIILGYISQYVSNNGYALSYREIADGVGIKSTCTVHTYMKILKEEGKLDYVSGNPRTIRLNEVV